MTRYTWIYTLHADADSALADALQADFDLFLNQWKTHGTPVKGSIQVHHHRFIIVQADPADDRPSGCSIDSMRHAVEAILQKHHQSWLDNGKIAYRAADDSIQAIGFQQIGSLLESGELHPDAIVFDNTLSHTDDLANWELPLKQTWMKRYLAEA